MSSRRKVDDKNLRATIIMLFLACVIMASRVSVCYATDRSDALTQISNAQIALQDAFQKVAYFWPNASDSARANATADLAASFTFLTQSERSADPAVGDYNSSYRFGVQAEFYAARATYRMVVDVTYSAIEQANASLTNIPKEMGKPPEAVELLGNATTIYFEEFNPGMLQVSPQGSVGIDTTRRIAANYLIQAVQLLYFSTGSAFSYASKAQHFITEYVSEQESARSIRVREYQSQLVYLILFVLAFCGVTVWYTTRKALDSGSKMIAKKGSRLARRVLGVMDQCANQKNLDIMLRTTGTLLSTVIALIAIVYFLSSIYASEGLRINLQFVSSSFGGILWPAGLLTGALIFGLLALTMSSRGHRLWRRFFASMGFYLFFLGGVAFVFTVYRLILAIS